VVTLRFFFGIGNIIIISHHNIRFRLRFVRGMMYSNNIGNNNNNNNDDDHNNNNTRVERAPAFGVRTFTVAV